MRCKKTFSVATRRENNELNLMEDSCLLKRQDQIQIQIALVLYPVVVVGGGGLGGGNKAEEFMGTNHYITETGWQSSQRLPFFPVTHDCKH